MAAVAAAVAQPPDAAAVAADGGGGDPEKFDLSFRASSREKMLTKAFQDFRAQSCEREML